MRETLKAYTDQTSIYLSWENGIYEKSVSDFTTGVGIIPAFDDAVMNAQQYGFSAERTKNTLEASGIYTEFKTEI